MTKIMIPIGTTSFLLVIFWMETLIVHVVEEKHLASSLLELFRQMTGSESKQEVRLEMLRILTLFREAVAARKALVL